MAAVQPAPARSQAAVVAAMCEPSFYGQTGPVEHKETHISHVFLVGDLAYKLKKELVLPFVDYGTLDRRLFFCREEMRLNRPLAPSVYRAVRAVIATASGLALAEERDPDALEYVVEMQRFREADTLTSYVTEGRCGPALMLRLGAHLAAFHAAAPPPEPSTVGTLAARVASDLEQLGNAAAGWNKPEMLRIALGATRAFTNRSAEQLAARAQRGLVREGHGDLRLEHVLVGDPIQLVDCVEFDAALRTCDVAYDLAFAVMDLHDQNAPGLANALLAGYRAAGGDPGSDALLAGMAACRALVRAKVAALRTPRRAGELGRFVALARRLLWLARSPLTVIVCGPAATGKTTLASELAGGSGLPHLSSDLVRKDRAGTIATTRLGQREYAPAVSRAVYEELGRRAREAAANNGSIVDATFRRADDRVAFDRAFAGAPGIVVVLRLAVPIAVARVRARQRAIDPARVSDAGPERAAAQIREFAPFDASWRAKSVELDADRPVPSLAELAEAAIDARLH
jgi:aminoglycoside phosphotransferase family enzyme/predicted kinase